MKQRTSLQPRSRRSPATQRRGVIIVLFAVLLTVIMAGIAFSVDLAFMQLTRTELQVASDAAAKAATVALAQGRNANQARDAAIAAAAQNKVAGRAFVINRDNIEIGGLRLGNGGTWDFVPNQTPNMAARVNANMTAGSASGQVNLFFAPLIGSSSFSPRNTSTAGFVQNAICLVLDRSGSMCFDMSGVEWSYPPDVPGYPMGYVTPPSPTESRWANLTRSVDLFLTILDESEHQSPVSLVTWANQVSSGNWYGVRYPRFNTTTIEVPFSNSNQGNNGNRGNGGDNGNDDNNGNDDSFGNSSSLIRGRMTALGAQKMMGGTNMAAGMTSGMSVLQAYTPTLPVNRVMILLTDGEWNAGSNPITVANAMAAANIKCHTIGVLTGPSYTVLPQISQITGGRYFAVSDQASMDAAFREIASDLKIVLTQ